jgi:outer membrane receptor protein involved in Fe transport
VESTIDVVDRFAYVSDEWELSPHWSVEPGLRYNLPDNRELASLGPRLRVKNQYDEGREAYLAWGQYHQAPLPQETDSTFGRADLKSRVSDHYVAGWEARLRPEMSLSLEAYYKNYRRLVVEVPDGRRYDNSGSGKARGAEVLLKWDEGGRLFGWLSYSLSKSERKNLYGPGWSRYQYDQPQTLSLVGSYELTPHWRVGSSAVFHSGPLVTPIVGRYYNIIEERWFPVLGRAFSERLPHYLRVDGRVDYTWFFERWQLSLYVEILNLFNRVNIQDYQYSDDYSSRKPQGRIPFLPYLGIRAAF